MLLMKNQQTSFCDILVYLELTLIGKVLESDKVLNAM